MTTEEKYIALAERTPLCLHEECPMKTTCMRWLIRGYMPTGRRFVQVVNPCINVTQSHGCEEFQSLTPASQARGFRHIFDNVPMLKAREISRQLQSDFTRVGYYRLKRGDRPLTTSERRRIEEMCRAAGVTEPIEFDTWEEGIE